MTHEQPADVEFSIDHDLDEDPLTMHVEVEGEPAAMLHCNLRNWFWNADPDGPLAHLRIDPLPADPDKAEWIFRPAIHRFLNPHRYSKRQAPPLREQTRPRDTCQAPRSLPPFLGKPRVERSE